MTKHFCSALFSQVSLRRKVYIRKRWWAVTYQSIDQAFFSCADVCDVLHQFDFVSNTTQMVDIGGSLQAEVIGQSLIEMVGVLEHLLLTCLIHWTILQ